MPENRCEGYSQAAYPENRCTPGEQRHNVAFLPPRHLAPYHSSPQRSFLGGATRACRVKATISVAGCQLGIDPRRSSGRAIELPPPSTSTRPEKSRSFMTDLVMSQCRSPIADTTPKIYLSQNLKGSERILNSVCSLPDLAITDLGHHVIVLYALSTSGRSMPSTPILDHSTSGDPRPLVLPVRYRTSHPSSSRIRSSKWVSFDCWCYSGRGDHPTTNNGAHLQAEPRRLLHTFTANRRFSSSETPE